MKKPSAGLLVFKTSGSGQLEVLLAHPGGPFWAGKDLGAWSLPKGEYEPSEQPFTAAQREFHEEIGQAAPEGDYLDLGEFKRSDGKLISAWAVTGDIDVSKLVSNSFELEWPPHSGNKQAFPEVDRAEWFTLTEAATKLSNGQNIFLTRLAEKLGIEPPIPVEQPKLL
jgi:predicted NUDIX family NTP pyrophosphohydrolase